MNLKRIALTFCVSCLTAGAVIAQDLGQATELFNMGATSLQSDDKEGALKYFKQALDMAGQLGEEGSELSNEIKALLPKLYLQIGKEAANAKEIAKAFENLELAKKTATEYNVAEVADEVDQLIPTVQMIGANDLLNDGKYAEAAAEYKKIIAGDASNATAYLRLGMALSKTTDQAGAIDAFTKAAELGEKEDAGKQLANIYLKQANNLYRGKKIADAYTNAQKAVQFAPENGQANKLFGVIALASKKYDDAIAGLEKYLAVTPNAKDKNAIMYQLATAFEGKGDKDKACGYYKQIVNDPQFKAFAEHKIKNELKCN